MLYNCIIKKDYILSNNKKNGIRKIKERQEKTKQISKETKKVAYDWPSWHTTLPLKLKFVELRVPCS